MGDPRFRVMSVVFLYTVENCISLRMSLCTKALNNRKLKITVQRSLTLDSRLRGNDDRSAGFPPAREWRQRHSILACTKMSEEVLDSRLRRNDE